MVSPKKKSRNHKHMKKRVGLLALSIFILPLLLSMGCSHRSYETPAVEKKPKAEGGYVFHAEAGKSYLIKGKEPEDLEAGRRYAAEFKA